MNSYEKAKAQIEQKKLYRKYEMWVYPQSDLGVSVLSEAGFFTDYNLYYQDDTETEEVRLRNAKELVKEALARRFARFSHRNVTSKEYRISLGAGSTPGYDRDLVEAVDYAIQITEIPVEAVRELTYDDIKEL